jgi:SAM-dependent methyltransferase
MKRPEVCTACGSPSVHFVRRVRSRRTDSRLSLYFCSECESFAMPSDHDQSTAREQTLKFHRKIMDRNLKWSRDLFRVVRDCRLPRKTVVEVGCGSGATLSVFQERGSRAIGYDLNPALTEFAEELGVDIRTRLWDRDHPPADLLLCISMIEHLNEPDALLAEFADYCRDHGTILAASVPLTRPETFRYALVPLERGSPFRAGDSHVMYYSPRGFQALLHRAGAEHVLMRKVHGWRVHFTAFEEAGARRLRAASDGPRLQRPRMGAASR